MTSCRCSQAAESRLSEGEAVVAWKDSTAEVTQPIHAHVVPKALYGSVEVGQGVTESEAQRVRPVGSATHEDLDGLVVGEGLVNAAAGVRQILAMGGRGAAPSAKFQQLAVEHVRSVVR